MVAAEFGAPLDGSQTRIVVDAAFAPLTAICQGPRAVALTSTPAGGARPSTRMSLKEGDCLVIDEVLTFPTGRKADQHLEFERRENELRSLFPPS